TDLLGVPATLIEQYGAVSDPVAAAMALGAVARSRAQVAISVTGIAGPGGGSPEKPVGLVYLGLARQGDAHAKVERHVFDGRRHEIRLQSVVRAIDLLFAAAG
ncbi:MAG: nicotinamide-nucleotide amidohydrolase family protein, partial [Dongiaceae bacterium]